MTHETVVLSSADDSQAPLHRAGETAARFGFFVVFVWFGAMKFTAYEAEAISGLISSSPLTGWAYAIASERSVSGLIGTVEIAAALLLLAGYARPFLGLIGAVLVTCTLMVTASFLLTAPVIEPSLGGLALNVLPGQFLLKDIALLGAAIWLAIQDYTALRR